jgi:hypothetical protein
MYSWHYEPVAAQHAVLKTAYNAVRKKCRPFSCRAVGIFREQSTGAATRLPQRKELYQCQSAIFFAGGAAIACLPRQPGVPTAH